ncbi:CxxxxCH/CxxCH domain-containing protein, partial [Geobacter pelophilus]
AGSGWNSAYTITDCKRCHGNDTSPDFTSLNGEPNYASTGASTDRGNGHKNHVSYGAGSCAFCHATTVTPGGTVIPGSTSHVLNYKIDVVAGNGIEFTYGSNKSCSDISCHGGKGSVTQYWGAPVSADCTGCHGNNAGSSLAIASGKHGAHINNP